MTAPVASLPEILHVLDVLLAAQGKLQFARENYDEAAAAVFGVALLDFLRVHGMEVRRRLATTEQHGSEVQGEEGVDTINAATLSDAADDPALGLPEARAMLRDASGLIRRLAATGRGERLRQGDVHAIACVLAREDGYDPEDIHGGLYGLRWSGGPIPEPEGDAWNMDYLPKAQRIVEALGGTTPPPAPAADRAFRPGWKFSPGSVHAVPDFDATPLVPAAVTWHRFEDRMPPSREWVMAKSRLTGKVAPLNVLTDWDAALIERYEGWHEIVAPAAEQPEFPECSGDPASCPENEGYGCCKRNDGSQWQPDARGEGMVPRSELDALYRAYVRLIESARDRIMDLGSECDPVDVMERRDPVLIRARAVLAAAPEQPCTCPQHPDDVIPCPRHRGERPEVQGEWKLVPVELTDEKLSLALSHVYGDPFWRKDARPIGEFLSGCTATESELHNIQAYGPQRMKAAYAAMIADAPAAPEPVLTDVERATIEALLNLGYAAWCLADNTEDSGGEGLTIERSDFAGLETHLNTLAKLPDDQPGYTMGEAAKARWALRRLLAAAPAAPGAVGVDEATLTRWRSLIDHAPSEVQAEITAALAGKAGA